MRDLWPDYCKRETLAKRLNIAAAAVDQLVKRGLLPPPIEVGEARLWRWHDVDDYLAKRHSNDQVDDPYLRGVHAAQASTPRKAGA